MDMNNIVNLNAIRNIFQKDIQNIKATKYLKGSTKLTIYIKRVTSIVISLMRQQYIVGF